jgi:hypothetical protein
MGYTGAMLYQFLGSFTRVILLVILIFCRY